MIEEWGQIKLNEGEIFKAVMNRLRDNLIKLNQRQLASGEDAEGQKLPPYSKPYARKRAKVGLPTDRKTLDFDHTFYSSFYTLNFENFTEIGAKDRKADWLENSAKILGSSVGKTFGLNDKNIDELIQLAIPILQEEVEKRIFV